MGIHWKSKQTQKNLLGKSTLAHKSSNLSPVLQAISPELVCPSGEQIVNGGFETGDFTGWTKTGDFAVYASNFPPSYEGTYFARNEYYIGKSGVISQNLANEVPVACFGESSIFQIACWGERRPSPPQGAVITIDIIYSDGSETTVQWEAPENEVWAVVNLKPYLEAGKKVKGIRITTDPNKFCGVDAISCIP
jgi:hypothetical protein